MPEIKPTFKSVSTDGTTLDDFTVTATLTNSTVGATTPPVYRVELVGTLSRRETVFAERDVLIAAGSDVSVSFTGLQKQGATAILCPGEGAAAEIFFDRRGIVFVFKG